MACLLACAHILGYLLERIYIPRVIGEVGAGIVLGPSILQYFYPAAYQWLFLGFPGEDKLFAIIYQFGLIMLMFCSGMQFETTFNKQDAKITYYIVIGSTVLPFIFGWLFTTFVDVKPFLGTAQNILALKIIISISIAVTSIPVISKIFFDLGIMHSRFAKLIISIAGIHDMILWVALGVATSLIGAGNHFTLSATLYSLLYTGLYISASLLILKYLFKRWLQSRQNLLFRASHIGYFFVTIFVVCGIAGLLKVEMIFGALLAGIAAKISLKPALFEQLENSIKNISFSWFVPVYFATVGLQLNISKEFDLNFFVILLSFAVLAQTLIVYLTCRMLALDHLTSINFGIALNARGGPGIVLSTIAYSLGIINQVMFGMLVLVALITSWMAGSWLRFILNRGYRLMPGDEKIKPSGGHGKADESQENSK